MDFVLANGAFVAVWPALGYLGWAWANYQWHRAAGEAPRVLLVLSLLISLIAGPIAILSSLIMARDYAPGGRFGLRFW